MDEEIDKKVKETLEKQTDLLSKLSASETNIHAVCELSSTMCQVAELLLDYLDI